MRDADWQSVGVTLAKDVGVYDRAKLRLVNGPHSTLTYLGLLRGHESVADAMRDEQLAQFVELLMTEDLAPSLGDAPGFDVGALHLRGAGAFPQSRDPPFAEPDRLGRLEEAARAPHGDHRRSIARRPPHPSAGDAHCRLDALHRAAGQSRRGHRRSGGRAPRAASARPAPVIAREDVARFAVFESVLPPALMAQEPFRRALETAYDKTGCATFGTHIGVILMSTSRRTFIVAPRPAPPMPEHPPP